VDRARSFHTNHVSCEVPLQFQALIEHHCHPVLNLKTSLRCIGSFLLVIIVMNALLRHSSKSPRNSSYVGHKLSVSHQFQSFVVQSTEMNACKNNFKEMLQTGSYRDCLHSLDGEHR